MASAKKGMSTETKVEIGVGAAALAAAAAGAGYYFYGDKGAKKHRAAASKWAKDMKTSVVKEAKKVKKLDQKAMTKIVDAAAAAYSTARSVDRNDITAAARELKKNWKAVQAEVSGAANKAVKSVKKSASNAKKTVKKAAPKKAAPKKAAPKKSAKKSTKKAR
ncbi:MAG: hypothetical protein JWL75_6 [Parcubacteria group bacterium]|nr:hypothetical protein [Parcubacteria group bacterium]